MLDALKPKNNTFKSDFDDEEEQFDIVLFEEEAIPETLTKEKLKLD